MVVVVVGAAIVVVVRGAAVVVVVRGAAGVSVARCGEVALGLPPFPVGVAVL